MRPHLLSPEFMSVGDSTDSDRSKNLALAQHIFQLFHPPIHRHLNLIVSAKSPCTWGLNEINHFGIFYKYVNFETFFRRSTQSVEVEPDLSVWLQAADEDDVLQYPMVWKVMEKITELHDPNRIPEVASVRESLTNMLTSGLLELYGYVTPGLRTIRNQYSTNFIMCGSSIEAVFDHAIISASRTYMLVGLEENKRLNPSGMIKAQIIGQSVAMFVQNNWLRDSRGLTPLTELIPVITMRGSSPSFYLVPVTRALADAVSQGVAPVRETVVLVYDPIPRWRSLRYNSGLSLLENRLPVTQAFIAFKQYLLSVEGVSSYEIGNAHSLNEGDRVHIF